MAYQRWGQAAADEGVLVLAGTPIGHFTDASPALVELLQHADVIAAEDTRLLQALLARLQIRSAARVMSYFEGNQDQRTATLLEHLDAGEVVAIVTDAGMPSISDPGYRIVTAAIAGGHRVTSVPGPSAVLTAVVLSGLKVDRFTFEGFLPRKPGERRRRLDELHSEARTMVFFEAPHRLAQFLTDAAETFGHDRPAAICRELTKPHEEVIRGSLAELVSWAKEHTRGEITVVIAGAQDRATDPQDALEQVRAEVRAGQPLSATVTQVAEASGLRRKSLYQQALQDRKTNPQLWAAEMREDRS